MEQESGKKLTGRIQGLFRSIFPLEHDFYGMLSWQAKKTLEGVGAFVDWLQKEPQTDPVRLEEMEDAVDNLRYAMEERLIDAFSTPFDRQDIYSLSRQMDYILNYAKDCAREMYAFGVTPDEPILAMARSLLRGTERVTSMVQVMGTDQKRVRQTIPEARAAIREIEDTYVHAMADLFAADDAMAALRRREIYYRLRDAGRALRATVDILHKAVVAIS